MGRAEAPTSNTLASATSPYLRQHADNPVHWQQWTAEALAVAEAEVRSPIQIAVVRDLPVSTAVDLAAALEHYV